MPGSLHNLSKFLEIKGYVVFRVDSIVAEQHQVSPDCFGIPQDILTTQSSDQIFRVNGRNLNAFSERWMTIMSISDIWLRSHARSRSG